MTTIRPATEADLTTVTEALASAFAEDPLFRWIAGADPTESIERKLHILFGAMAKAELSSPDHLAFITVDGAGAHRGEQGSSRVGLRRRCRGSEPSPEHNRRGRR